MSVGVGYVAGERRATANAPRPTSASIVTKQPTSRKTSAARYYWPTREPHFDGLIDSTDKFRSRRVGSSASDREMRACRDGRDRDAKSAFSPVEEKIRANGARGIRARADVGDDAHEADAARGRRRDPPEVGRAALRQPATPHRCVSRRNRRLPPGEQRPTGALFSRRGAEKRRASRGRSGKSDALARRGRAPRARRRELGHLERPRARRRARTHPHRCLFVPRGTRQNIFSSRESDINARKSDAASQSVSLEQTRESVCFVFFSILFLSRILYRSR